MTLEFFLFLLSVCICCVTAFILALLWFSDRRNRQMPSFFLLGVLVIFWILFNAVTMVVNKENFPVIFTLRMVFVCIIPFAVLRFFVNLTGNRLSKSRLFTAITLALVAIELIMLLSNPLHRLMFKDYSYPVPIRGVYFWVHLVLSFGVVILAFTLLIIHIAKNARKNPGMIITGAGTLVPYVINMFYTFGVINYSFDLTPIGFFIMIMLFVQFSYRSQLLSLKTTALNDIFQTLDDIIVLESPAGIITDVNSAFIRAFPNFKLQAGRTHIKELADYFDNKAVSMSPPGFLKEVVAQGNHPSGEFTLIGENGAPPKTYTVVAQKIVTSKWRKESSGYALTINDVSSYRSMIDEINQKNEKLEALKTVAESASLAKSRFLSNMSHEIRTPLNAIIGMAQIAEKSKDNSEKVSESVERINTASQHLLGIINDVLDMSKIESGKFDLSRETFALHEALEEVSILIYERCAEKQIEFIFNSNVPKNISVEGDKLRLKQILINLLGNAVKFTPQKGKVVFESVMEEKNYGASVTFNVTDTGIGMTDEQKAKLFSAFEQTDATITSKFGGTGLGLAISQNLAQMMGGVITAQSEPGKGSVFSFTLNMKISSNDVSEKFDGEEADISGRRILLAEDIEINRIIVQELFNGTGAIIDEAENGEEAVKMFSSSPEGYYDVIFMDIQMPLLNGYDATRRIRALTRPDAKTVKIFAMSANVFQEDKQAALDADMNCHLSKPIDMSAVMRALKEFL